MTNKKKGGDQPAATPETSIAIVPSALGKRNNRRRGGATGAWTSKTARRRDAAIAIANELRAEWPLSVRQLYYQCVARGIIENKANVYDAFVGDMASARLQGLLSWEAIEDRTRRIDEPYVWDSAAAFADAHITQLTHGYHRDLLQGQHFTIEVWIEKDALAPLAKSAAFEYCVPVVSARGFASVTVKHDLAERAAAAGKEGRDLVIVYCGDFDPSGLEMTASMMRTVVDELGATNVTLHRIALTREQIDEYQLPLNPNALKRRDTRAAKFLVAHGDLSVELDALPPEVLRQIVKEGIERFLDVEEFNRQVAIEQHERNVLFEKGMEMRAMLGRGDAL